MAAQLSATGEEQSPAIVVPDTSAQRREDVPQRIEHANEAAGPTP